MYGLDLILTLRDDLVASRTPATEGGHETLDFLPGGMLLGAAAARLYPGLSPADAWQLFHSGRVRFGDGLPLDPSGSRGWPMPLCWHERKDEGALPKGSGPLDPAGVRNFQHLDGFPDGRQPKQLREHHVTSHGQVIKAAKSFRMKTAIEPEAGRVAEGQLFGYEALAAGQRFAARIEADPTIAEPLWNRLVAAFLEPSELLLGRSRSAEYGRVRVQRGDESQDLAGPQAGADGNLTLWCLSDLGLVDELGQPGFEPTPGALGLQALGEVRWDKTFLRFRRYAPWNAHRRAYDLERQVIERGSVIALKLQGPLGEADRRRLAAGVGLWREAGLGRVWLNPPLLAGPEPRFAAPPPALTETAPPPRPDHPLIVWLQGGSSARVQRNRAEDQARKLADALDACYRQARAFAGVPATLPVGPSPAQWGTVYERARAESDLARLGRGLFEGGDAVCKPKGEGWQDEFLDQGRLTTFFDWFKNEYLGKDNRPGLDSIHAVRAFARAAQDIAKGAHGRGNPEKRP